MEQEHKTSNLQTLLHVFKAHTGAGMFAMGYVIESVGLIVGTILTPIIPLIVLHAYFILLGVTDALWMQVEGMSGHFSIKEMENQKYSLQNYCYIAEKVFEVGRSDRLRKYSVVMRVVVLIFTYSMHLGFCMIYLVFAATNFKQIYDPYHDMSIRLWLCVLIAPIYLMSLCPSLKFLSVISAFGNFCLLSGCAISYYYVTQDLGEKWDTLHYSVDIMQFPIYLCVTIFSFAAITTVLPFRAEMKHPEAYTKPCGVLNVGYFLVIALISTLGVLSYCKYGSDIKESVTLNFPRNWLGTTTRVVVTTSVLVTCPINIYIPTSILWPTITEKYGPFEHPTRLILVYKSVLVIFTFLCALIVPYIELLMSLVAAISSTILTFVVPPVLEMNICYSTDKPVFTRAYYWIKNVLLIILGIIIFFVGSGTTIDKIIRAFKADR